MSKDPYESLCRYYEFMVGRLPRRDQFKLLLHEMITPEELSVFFHIPFSGKITFDKLKRKARLPEERLREILNRLAPEGFILAYDKEEGRVYERGVVSFMTEQQVRKNEDTPRRTFLAGLMNALIEGETADVPNKTPYYRVVPVEPALVGARGAESITTNIAVPDTRQALPFEVISEMLKSVHPIGVAECYCRKTKRVLGQGCDHPLETCFVFDGIGQSLIESGIAREISYEEAMDILRECEKQGLVHNVDNSKEIHSLCNCCPCCCVIMKMHARGETNAGGPSRYVAHLDALKCTLQRQCVEACPTQSISIRDGVLAINDATCLGCGHCVAACPEGALSLHLREKQPFMAETHHALWSKISREAIVGMALKKILRR